jgi:hypothetical protein
MVGKSFTFEFDVQDGTCARAASRSGNSGEYHSLINYEMAMLLFRCDRHAPTSSSRV